ncbi:hypothetical protein I548_3024 [Mycobacterium intracellulare]|nr:hypothetical protein I548_3024 [Mycobacterium intracellulare]
MTPSNPNHHRQPTSWRNQSSYGIGASTDSFVRDHADARTNANQARCFGQDHRIGMEH